MIKSLNEAYKKNSIFCWSNSFGEVTLPGDGPLSPYRQASDLPKEHRELYDNFLNLNADHYMFVVDCNEEPAIAMSYLFDEGYLEDIAGCKPTAEDMEEYFAAINKVAEEIANRTEFSDCDVLVGKNTDGFGHELVLIVPYANRDKIKDISYRFAEFGVYEKAKKILGY